MTELKNLLRAVLEYNGKSVATGVPDVPDVVFYDSSGAPVALSGIEIFCTEATGLKVRTAPDNEPNPESAIEQQAAKDEAQALTDPKKIPAPMPMSALEKMLGI